MMPLQRSNQLLTLASPKLSCGGIANAADRLARLLLLRQPVANMLDVVEDEATNFRAWRTQASSSEALHRAYRTMELSRKFGFANVAVENRWGRIGKVTHRPFLPVRFNGQSTKSVPDDSPKTALRLWRFRLNAKFLAGTQTEIDPVRIDQYGHGTDTDGLMLR